MVLIHLAFQYAALSVTVIHTHTVSHWQVCRDKNSLIEPELLKKEHKKHHKAALKLFEDTPKIGGDQFAEKYRRELEEKIGSYHSKLEEICQVYIIIALNGLLTTDKYKNLKAL